MTKSTILSGTDLNKKYGDLEVVKNVSLAIDAGEFVCLVGKSGCGKTTLLSLLSGLERPTKGDVVLSGKKINGASEDELALFRRENVGFIFQSFNLIPTLSAWENVALPLFPIKMKGEESNGGATMAIPNRPHPQERVAIPVVTHEVELAKSADRLIRMQDGEVIS